LISETGRIKDARELRDIMEKRKKIKKNCAPNILLIETKERKNTFLSVARITRMKRRKNRR